MLKIVSCSSSHCFLGSREQVFIQLVGITSQVGFGGDSCPTLFQQLPSFTIATKTPWDPENFTAPVIYQPGKKFRFLVRALRDGPSFKEENIASEQADYYVNQLKLLIEDPQKMISDVPAFSGSLISHEKRHVFGDAGVILESPPENIVATHGVDMMSWNQTGRSGIPTEENLQSLRKMYGISTPDELLEKTKGDYNEIVFRAVSPSGSRVRVNGLYVFIHNGEPLCSEEMYRMLQDASRRNGLPLILLQP